MKASEVYLRAAERVASFKETYSCLAIAHAADASYGSAGSDKSCYDYEAVTNYLDIFARGNDRALQSAIEDQWSRPSLHRHLRVMLLCFAAAIAASEEAEESQ